MDKLMLMSTFENVCPSIQQYWVLWFELKRQNVYIGSCRQIKRWFHHVWVLLLNSITALCTQASSLQIVLFSTLCRQTRLCNHWKKETRGAPGSNKYLQQYQSAQNLVGVNGRNITGTRYGQYRPHITFNLFYCLLPWTDGTTPLWIIAYHSLADIMDPHLSKNFSKCQNSILIWWYGQIGLPSIDWKVLEEFCTSMLIVELCLVEDYIVIDKTIGMIKIHSFKTLELFLEISCSLEATPRGLRAINYLIFH